jgi:hypothetical protein
MTGHVKGGATTDMAVGVEMFNRFAPRITTRQRRVASPSASYREDS